MLLPFAGCGRIGFETNASEASDASDASDASEDQADSAPAALQLEFGTGPGADYSLGTRDTYLYQSEPGINFGDSTLLDADPSSHSLLFFDLSVLAPTMTVLEAQLCLTAIRNDAPNGTATVNLVSESWDEGSGGPGASNWTQRTAALNWNNAGGDFGAVIGSFDSVMLGDRLCVELDADAIEVWVSAPEQNFGMGTISAGYAGGHPHFCSLEAMDEDCRPALHLSVRE